MNRYSMEVFAEARRAGLLEEAETRRLLKTARQTSQAVQVAGASRTGVIGRGLAWLGRLARPGRSAAAS